MRRSLVLTNEAARHWLRQMIPPSSMKPEPVSGSEDMRLFLMTFVAGFMAFYGFIA